VEHIDQTNESDANLLIRLAHQHDAIATVKSGRLLFIKAGDAESATGKPFPLVKITRASGDAIASPWPTATPTRQ
jgi:phage protein D